MGAEFLRYRNEINFPLDSSSRTRALLGQHLLVFPTLRLHISGSVQTPLDTCGHTYARAREHLATNCDSLILRDIEFHGAPVIDKLFFLSPNDVIAQWGDKLFLIGVDQSMVTPLPDIPGELRIDLSGKVLAVQQESVSKLYTLPSLQQTASLAGPTSTLLQTADEGRLLAFETNRLTSSLSISGASPARPGSAAFNCLLS
jgi:hypothetical protein